VIFVFEPSPITVGLPAIVAKWLKRAPIAFWVLDLWPQSLEAVGVVRNRSVLWLVDRLVRFVYRHSDRILAQSKSFVPAIASQANGNEKIVYFPSWSEPLPNPNSVERASEIETRPDLFTIVFTGNIGKAQDFAAVLDAVERLRDEPVRWIVVGDGREAHWLTEEIKRRALSQVVMPGRFPLERMSSFMSHADALLVSLRDEPIFSLTIPGKLQSYLSTGIPILAMLNGEGADIVTSAGTGIAVPAGEGAALAEAVQRLREMSPDARRAMGAKGPAYVRGHFDRDELVSRLEQLLSDMSSSYSRRYAT
jgi:glycosyltransferase involved in cell wall biosynthesis